MNNRRNFLRTVFAGALAGSYCLASASALAHTPYSQWQVYRRKHLLIGCHKDVASSYALAKTIVATLDQHLPDASARVARAPDAQRLASLMATDQMDVAIVSPANALAMAQGSGQFAPYGAVPLNVLMSVSGFLLVCREDIPARHAWLVTDALLDSVAGSDAASAGLPLHPGASLRHAGEEMPG